MIRIKNIADSGRDVACRKVVIKLGSQVLMDGRNRFHASVVRSIADDVARLREQKVDVILVTSGAIGTGCNVAGRPRPRLLPDKQALAAIGQITLMHRYQQILARRGLMAAQLLLTRADMEDRHRYLNARYTLERLLALGAVPIVNENDTTATEEITFGDNDGLAAFVAMKMKADLLLLLTVVDGLYRPKAKGRSQKAKGKRQKAKNAGASGSEALDAGNRAGGERECPDGDDVIPVVESLDEDVYRLIESGGTAHGRGGMRSKLDAARTAGGGGVHTVIANGKRAGVVAGVFSGRFRGTYFPASRAAISSREHWIGFGKAARGAALTLDAGAVEAIVKRGKSLLPVGVIGVRGRFEKGDLVELRDEAGRTVARGMVNFSSEEVERLKGARRDDPARKTLAVRYDEIVHRDNMALVG